MGERGRRGGIDERERARHPDEANVKPIKSIDFIENTSTVPDRPRGPAPPSERGRDMAPATTMQKGNIDQVDPDVHGGSPRHPVVLDGVTVTRVTFGSRGNDLDDDGRHTRRTRPPESRRRRHHRRRGRPLLQHESGRAEARPLR